MISLQEVIYIYINKIIYLFARNIKTLIVNFSLWITKFPKMFSSGLNCNLSFPSCLGYPQDSEELIPKMAREPIILNVYDMVSSIYIINKMNIIVNCFLLSIDSFYKFSCG
jgi:hypothetical protein